MSTLLSMAVLIFRATHGPISRRPSCPVQCQDPLCRDISQMGFWFARGKKAVVRWVRERSEEHTSELQSPCNLVCRLLLEKKKKRYPHAFTVSLCADCTHSTCSALYSRLYGVHHRGRRHARHRLAHVINVRGLATHVYTPA